LIAEWGIGAVHINAHARDEEPVRSGCHYNNREQSLKSSQKILTSNYERSQHGFFFGGQVENGEQQFHRRTHMAGDQACPVIL
jgi:hypothetical protein